MTVAHEDAYTKCKILHRDVSGKNVLLVVGGHGILNDWDLAKRVDNCERRHHERTVSGSSMYGNRVRC